MTDKNPGSLDSPLCEEAEAMGGETICGLFIFATMTKPKIFWRHIFYCPIVAYQENQSTFKQRTVSLGEGCTISWIL